MAVLVAGVSLSACASLTPPSVPPPSSASATASTPSRTPPSAVAWAQATHEYPGPPPPRQSAPGSKSAVEAVSAFAAAYINWSAQTVATDMQALARASVGQARSAMELAAVQTSSDYELQRGGIANAGVVEAVASLPGSADQFVVVTREHTTATATGVYQGLQPAWHVALATVVRLGPGRWAVSGWQPES